MSLIKALKHKRDPEAVWREGGWGPRRTFLTTGFAGEPLAAVVGTSGAIAVQGVMWPIEREGRPEVRALLSMTVALSELPIPAPESVPDTEVKPVEFKDEAGDYRGTRIRQIRRREVRPGVLPFLTVQFMLETEHGWLVITFATPQTKFFIRIEGTFDKVAETCRLGLPT